MFTITAADHDAQGVQTHRATPRSGHDLQAVQAFMVMQAGDVLMGRHHRVAVLASRHIRLERKDATGGTTWTITEAS